MKQKYSLEYINEISIELMKENLISDKEKFIEWFVKYCLYNHVAIASYSEVKYKADQ